MKDLYWWCHSLQNYRETLCCHRTIKLVVKPYIHHLENVNKQNGQYDRTDIPQYMEKNLGSKVHWHFNGLCFVCSRSVHGLIFSAGHEYIGHDWQMWFKVDCNMNVGISCFLGNQWKFYRPFLSLRKIYFQKDLNVNFIFKFYFKGPSSLSTNICFVQSSKEQADKTIISGGQLTKSTGDSGICREFKRLNSFSLLIF